MRKFREGEIIPFARNTGFVEIAEKVIPDRDGEWQHPLIYTESRHRTKIGTAYLGKAANDYLEKIKNRTPIDILSVTTGIDGDELCLCILIRVYKDIPNFTNLYDYLGEFHVEKLEGAGLIVPDEAKKSYTAEEIETHRERVEHQQEALANANEDVPFLNAIDSYTPIELSEIDTQKELVYDLLTKDRQLATHLEYENFIAIFNECMQYVTSVERDCYYGVLRETTTRKEFDYVVEAYIRDAFIMTNRLPEEDLPALMKKIDRALFQLYIVQDLIEDPDITDVKITAPDSIRVRVKGRAYLSNVHFIDAADYDRFIRSVAAKNNIDLKQPTQTFTDEHDKDYILRFTITAPYVTGTGLPIIHIRKVPRKKMMADDLIKAGMMDEKIRDYLIDCGKYSRGVVFAGAPGSGKTVMLNWFLEDAYESSAEILVIQENDELFCYRKGVMFQHVVNNPQHGEKRCTLEDLGQMALVAGANVFVIGEAKGAEICSAITLSNSGCRTAITIHSPSSTETIDKMADLAMRGYATSYAQAKRMIKSFQTIVYLKDFKVQEISEIIGYDDKKEDMIYRHIYKRPHEET